MFKNISVKIRIVAKIAAWIGIISSVIIGFVLMLESALGLLVLVVGALVSWGSSLFLYGFGELIEQTELINANTYELCRLLKSHPVKEENKEDSKNPHTTSVNINNRSTGGTWTCPKCKKTYDNTTRICNECGYMK